jgi:transcriptional regulator with XRE-family HTH domain
LSQTDLSDRSGLPKPTISRYENDRVTPSLLTLRRLASALGIMASELLPGPDTPDEVFVAALRDNGITFGSTADARRLADLVAEVIRERSRDKRGSTG